MNTSDKIKLIASHYESIFLSKRSEAIKTLEKANQSPITELDKLEIDAAKLTLRTKYGMYIEKHHAHYSIVSEEHLKDRAMDVARDSVWKLNHQPNGKDAKAAQKLLNSLT